MLAPERSVTVPAVLPVVYICAAAVVAELGGSMVTDQTVRLIEN